MREIGILTFWNVPNYGAFLQCYAMQKVMESRYKDCRVRQIGHLNNVHYGYYYSIVNTNYKVWLLNPRFYKKLFYNIRHYKEIIKTRKFLEYYKSIPHVDVLIEDDLKQLCLDILILGSDIIWDYSLNVFGKDKFLFGNKITAKAKISYAPSIGTITPSMKVPSYVIGGLKNLDGISVRDNKSKVFIKENIERDALIVLDPTLMWDFMYDENIIKPELNYNYVLVYGSYFGENIIAEAKRYCHEQELKLICLSSLDDNYDWCDQNINIDELNPFEWVGYFKSAFAIMTCTYHGLLFGLIFKKPIIFYPTDFILQKATSLIDELKLTDVLIHFRKFEEKIDWHWDYTEIDKLIADLKYISIRYLDEAINNE